MANGPAAFYLAGSLDGSRPGVFYVNTYKFDSQPKGRVHLILLRNIMSISCGWRIP